MTMQKKMLKTAAAACAAALAAVLLAGCGDEASKKTYSPVPFTKHDRCHLCGMVLAHYEGPKAQIIIKGAERHTAHVLQRSRRLHLRAPAREPA